MKKKDILELMIEEVAFPSIGIAFHEGKSVYIKNTIPGQKVKVFVNKVKDAYAEGKTLEILERSPMEQDSFCTHFGLCGGCIHQTIAYSKQLEMKAEQVKKLLDAAGIQGYEFLGIEGSPKEFAYRNKMEYSFGDAEKDGDLTLGMHKKGKFNSVVTVEQCKIVDEDFNQILKNTLSYFRRKNVPRYNSRFHKGYLRHLVVRKGKKTGEILVNLVTSTQMQFSMEEWVNLLKGLRLEGKIVGILHTFNDNLSDVVVSDRTEVLWGQDYFMEEILGLRFKISAFSFFQTNSLGAEKLYNMVLDFIEDAQGKTIFDLYSGTGTIGQIVAKKAKKVIGIEIVEEAVEAANKNAKMNGLENCTFIAGDVLKKIDELKEKPDIIILDPPRAGVHPKALKKILNYRAPEIVYVSCNPKTLAENLKDVQQAGYRVNKVKAMDMFPHTTHVECVTLMSRV
ncbi:23S rRNA (uracil(1939)-C(5))-methyltransferase RlmD [Thermotalea metallivorans]|uniref:23S rRNA (Uracil-C(5))-methyltransferase RlmCD n=1 Tax=Thermotalea metallivorans TaxID=520762 RepID=A0A140L445_9FIRM|nr:23S rRNA (uracil(1939)-C(5))-methyltransferase RlmD [Thermotalea metallivorans]KXG75320.1 23S rRNA (uracil-C(5))-methyltransferase RlmCD [Thermotalea metallivorans]